MFLIPDDSWEVRKTMTKGRGIFAMKEITAGTVIGDYLGKVIRTADESDIDEKDNFYLMFYHDYASIFPDLTKPGIHLLNHSCTPNVWMYTYHGHTLFFVLRRIFPGEEMTVSYLLSPQKDCPECTHFCICNSILCYGTMHMAEKRHAEWSEFHEKEAAKTGRQRIRYGKNLPKLKTYPQSIPDARVYTLFAAKGQKAIVKEDETLPSVSVLRESIRETGRAIDFPNLKQRVLGITESLICSESLR